MEVYEAAVQRIEAATAAIQAEIDQIKLSTANNADTVTAHHQGFTTDHYYFLHGFMI